MNEFFLHSLLSPFLLLLFKIIKLWLLVSTILFVNSKYTVTNQYPNWNTEYFWKWNFQSSTTRYLKYDILCLLIMFFPCVTKSYFPNSD